MNDVSKRARAAVAVLVAAALTIVGVGTPAAAADWTGSFTAAYAEQPVVALSAGTKVWFSVSAPLSSAQIRVFVGSGVQLTGCTTGSSCYATSNPAPGTSETYYAEVWRLIAGAWVRYETSPPVRVTDPGWTGTFTSATAQTGDYAFFGASSARFTWNQPLQYVRIDVVDTAGEVLGTCSAAGLLECSAAAALGPGETRMVHAEARVPLAGGGFVTVATSSPVELTGMDADAFAAFILTAPEAALPPLLGTARAAQAVEIRSATQSQTFCVALGAVLPANAMFHSSTPDATLLCVAGVGLALGYLIGAMGVDLALDIMSDAAGTDDQLGAPSHDPNVRDDIFNTPDCYHYDFDGNCLDVSSNPAAGSHVQTVPVPDFWGGLICRAVHVDAETGERNTYELRGDRLRHIIEDHVARPPLDKGVWDADRFNLPTDSELLASFEIETLPGDYQGLIDFLCSGLAGLDRHDGGQSLTNPENEVSIYVGPGGFVGTDGLTTEQTVYFTVVTKPDGQVWSAYPGRSAFTD